MMTLHAPCVLVSVLLFFFSPHAAPPDPDRRTALHIAALEGHLPVVEGLIRAGRPVDMKEVSGWTPLHLATERGHLAIVRVLLDHGANVDARQNVEVTPLHLAAMRGHAAIAGLLLERGASLRAREQGKGMLPLHHAALMGHVEVIDLLLSAGAPVDAIEEGGRTPKGLTVTARRLVVAGESRTHARNQGRTALHLASLAGEVEAVRRLLEGGADLAARQNSGWTALHFAAAQGHDPVLSLLLERGAPVDGRDEEGLSPIHRAALETQLPCVRILLEKKADFHARDEQGRLPLHLSAMSGSRDITKLLLTAGADVDARNNWSWTPLHIASHLGRVEAADLLLDHGADPEARQRVGGTPLHAAAFHGHHEIIELLEAHEVDLDRTEDGEGHAALHIAVDRNHPRFCARLLVGGARIDLRNLRGETPLALLAARRDDPDLARLLLDHGAELEAVDSEGKPPLRKAAESGHARLAALLIARGARIESRTADHRTALHVAASLGFVEIASALLDGGARPDAMDRDRNTALHLAAKAGHAPVVAVLLERGARRDRENGAGQTAAEIARASQYRGSRHAEVLAVLDGIKDAARARSRGAAPPVLTHQKISALQGNFHGQLVPADPSAGRHGGGSRFGRAIVSLGDLNGDGAEDLAVGAPFDDDGGADCGAVWILFLAPDGTLLTHQKISRVEGNFSGVLCDVDQFGESLANLGDLNGDGVVDLAVGAPRDDADGVDRGALWILFLERDGTVKSSALLDQKSVPALSSLADGDLFASSLAALGDLDGNGTRELAVGAPKTSDGGMFRGAVWILSLDERGTVDRCRKISNTDGSFGGELGDCSLFGQSVASLGDLDRDGVPDLAVGAPLTSVGGTNQGALWILFLDRDGSVKSQREIRPGLSGFDGAVLNGDRLADALASPGDWDGDGVPDLLCGASYTDDAGRHKGAVWVLNLARNGSVLTHAKISAVSGGFRGALDEYDEFGCAVAGLGLASAGGGLRRCVVGAWLDDDGGPDHGALWLLDYDVPKRRVSKHAKIGGRTEQLEGRLGNAASSAGRLPGGSRLGRSVVHLGDLDGDGLPEVASGAVFDDDGGPDRGAVWILSLRSDGTVRKERKISDLAGGFEGELSDFDIFGQAVGALGDLDGDGVPDLAVSATGDDDGGFNQGAVWVLFLERDGTVKRHRKISALSGDFHGRLDPEDRFGVSLCGLPDLDGDGVPDLAVGARRDDDGGEQRGAVWILFLRRDGTVRSHQKISDTRGEFLGVLDDLDMLGRAIACPGDLDGDGTLDLAVGARRDDDGGEQRGAVWILFLERSGRVKAHQKISDLAGGFTGQLCDHDRFGIAVASVGDLDGDGVFDLAVGAERDDDGGPDRGALWLLRLRRDGTVKSHRKISDLHGGFTADLQDRDKFGISVTWVGDLDANGSPDLVVGATGDNDGGKNNGALYTLFLRSPRAHRR